VSDCTSPNKNHTVVPGLAASDPWIDVGYWNVPLDDTHTMRFVIYSVPSAGAEADERIRSYFEAFGDYNPADHQGELLVERKVPQDELIQCAGLRRRHRAGSERRSQPGAARQIGRRNRAVAAHLLARARRDPRRPADQGLAPAGAIVGIAPPDGGARGRIAQFGAGIRPLERDDFSSSLHLAPSYCFCA